MDKRRLPLSQGHKIKISEALKGIPRSIETRKKISEAQRGEKHHNFGKSASEETRRKMSESHKGLNTWMRGRHLSEETRKKISEAQKGHVGYSLGKHHTLKTRKKMSESHKKEKNYSWKGGITPINEQVRHSFEMKEWRNMVFGRDYHTCKGCGARGIYLNAHHIKPFSKYPELRLEVSNGITLCRPCHEKTRGKEEEFVPLLQTLVLNKK